jgi:phosphomannomutase
MVTASHNPAKYNGCKVCRDGSQPVGEASGLADIEATVLANDFDAPDRKGTVTTKHVLAQYIAFTTRFLHAKRSYRVVIDAGNGMGGLTYGALLGKIPNVEIMPMYFELDGSFPNHEADPLKIQNLAHLRERVRAQHADLGVALDGDEDRIAFVDEHGEPIASDITTALLARDVLREHPKATILYDVRLSRLVPQEIAQHGGTAIMTRVGHAFIKVAMREHHAAFGGELSGHYYNAEQSNTESTQLAFFRLLNIIESEGKTLSEITQPLCERYAKTPEINYHIADPSAAIAALERAYAHVPDAHVTRIDGVRVDFPRWWFNVRASNTEPLLRLNLEADDARSRDAFVREISARIAALGGSPVDEH